MKKSSILVVLCVLAALAAAGVLRGVFRGAPGDVSPFEAAGRPPAVHPDCAGVTLPPNICPLRFVVDEPGETYHVRVSSDVGGPIEIRSPSPAVLIPVKPWRTLLEANRGRQLRIEVSVRRDGRWLKFSPLVNTVAGEDIDPYVVYRDISAYSLIWTDIGIYERCLESFETRRLLHNSGFRGGCCNCHSFLKKNPENTAMNVRGSSRGRAVGGGLLIARGGVVRHIVDTKTAFNPIPAIYLAWHPSGRAIAFSTNKIAQTFHDTGDDRHSTDSFSDVGIYLTESNLVTTAAEVARADRLETSPEWSPDGGYLYFCSGRPTVTPEERSAREQERKREIDEGKRKGPVWTERHEPYFRTDRYRELRYDLVRIRYDLDANEFRGEVETVLTTDAGRAKESFAQVELPPEAKGKLWSFAQPKCSPDGRFVLLCLSAWGNFPVYQETSDLYLLDLGARKCRPLTAVNGSQSESWHCWSSNGRWIVFSSKRPEGLLTRPWICHIDGEGRASKPFILPQKDPAFYDRHIRMFNRPEFATGRVPLDERRLLKALHAPDKQLKAQLDPKLRKLDGFTGATSVQTK